MNICIYDRRTLVPSHMKFYYDFIKLFTKKCKNDDVGTLDVLA